MSDSNDPRPRPVDRAKAARALFAHAPEFLLGAAATFVCYLAAGASLGLVIGGLYACTALLPPLAAGREKSRGRLASATAGVVGAAAVWLALVGPGRATAGQWATVTLLLAAYVLFLIGLAAALERLKLSPVVSAAVAVVVGVGWLAWPVWVSPGWGLDSGAALAVRVQPVLVANGVLTFTPPWTEQAIAYRWTALDQDLTISLPPTAVPGIGLHAGVGGALICLSRVRRRRGRSRNNKPKFTYT